MVQGTFRPLDTIQKVPTGFWPICPMHLVYLILVVDKKFIYISNTNFFYEIYRMTQERLKCIQTLKMEAM